MNTPRTDALDEKHGEAITPFDVNKLCVDVLNSHEEIELELIAEQEKVRELREALSYMLGPIDDEKIGWRGRNPPSNDHFGCEFCAKSHLDCTLIEHQDDCPVTIARAILEKTK